MQPLLKSHIPSLKLLNQGKVRDLYDIDAHTMLLVATDRLSAFDVVLPTPIEHKGAILTQIANFWFDKLAHIVPNHLTGIAPESVVETDAEKAQLGKRAIVVKKLKPLPIEAIVRGYLAGSGWKEYKASGTVCGIPLPAGLQGVCYQYGTVAATGAPRLYREIVEIQAIRCCWNMEVATQLGDLAKHRRIASQIGEDLAGAFSNPGKIGSAGQPGAQDFAIFIHRRYITCPLDFQDGRQIVGAHGAQDERAGKR
jgi:hypothetical protein